MNLTSLPVRCSIALIPALMACGKTDPAPQLSRSIPGVLLFSNAEGASAAGFLPDDELSKAGASLKGGWYTYDDVGDCPEAERPRPGMVMPTMGQTFVVTKYGGAIMPPPGEEEDNTAALRFWGGGYNKWGAGIGIGFNNPGGKPLKYDLTKVPGATGIRLWIRSAIGDVDVKIKLQDKWSEGEADPQMCCFLDKAVCGNNACGVSEEQGCFDAPNVIRTAKAEWQKFEIPFTDFVREGWGKWVNGEDHAMEPLALTETHQLQLEVGTVEAFDVWVDNVGFTIPVAAQ